MHRRALRLIVLTLLLAAAGSVAHAEFFTVTMTNGTSFQTRYRPEPAEWDENVLLLSTETGNWIGLHSDEVADITSHVEITGFGYQVNTTTLFVGWVPNDIDKGGEKEGEGLDLEEMFPQLDESFTLEQFVDVPGPEGGSIGNQGIEF